MAKRDKGDKNGSTLKGVAITIVILLACVGAYTVWQMLPKF